MRFKRLKILKGIAIANIHRFVSSTISLYLKNICYMCYIFYVVQHKESNVSRFYGKNSAKTPSYGFTAHRFHDKFYPYNKISQYIKTWMPVWSWITDTNHFSFFLSPPVIQRSFRQHTERVQQSVFCCPYALKVSHCAPIFGRWAQRYMWVKSLKVPFLDPKNSAERIFYEIYFSFLPKIFLFIFNFCEGKKRNILFISFHEEKQRRFIL